MDAKKPWYLSRTVWASIVTVLAAGAGLVGLPLAESEHEAVAETLLQLATAAAGAVALYGRLSARNRIG